MRTYENLNEFFEEVMFIFPTHLKAPENVILVQEYNLLQLEQKG